MIGRGTTPTIEFTLREINPANIVAAYMTITQNDLTVLEKDITDMGISNNRIYWELSQDETLLFSPDVNCLCQIRVRTADGRSYDSPLAMFKVLPILKDGVI